ncbi:MAG: SigF/SigG family RNA polymerase sporulation sigma factor [Peptococcaceae bacterium]|nr:SigF/SigG family RNA polymerase sporulation sigma factor [Peptococcaceae bacterium]
MDAISAKKLASGPVLNEEDTQALIRRLRAGEIEVQDLLLAGHLRLVYSIVARFLNSGHDPEDLFQIGSIGLLKAIKKFDLSYNVRFSTYAVPLIIGEIRRFLRDDGPIKVSRSVKETAVKVRRANDELRKKLDREPRISEIAEFLELCEEDVIEAIEALRAPSSLEEKVFQDDGNPVYLVDRVKQEDSGEEGLVEGLALRQIMKALTPREQRIITARYFENKTQTQVAEELSVSQVQISRLEKAILTRLRQMLL